MAYDANVPADNLAISAIPGAIKQKGADVKALLDNHTAAASGAHADSAISAAANGVLAAGTVRSQLSLLDTTQRTAKTTPADADLVGLNDSAASNALKKLTWANIKAAIWAAIHAATSKTTPVDADELPLLDSAATYGIKRLTWTNVKATLKTYFDTLYAAINHNLIDTTKHPVSGLTAGHFLKATGATTYGFAAHGLSAADVSALPTAGGTMSGAIAMGSNKITGLAAGVNSGDAVNLGQFADSVAAYGYQKLPGGLIIQWGGKLFGSSATSAGVTFPLAFPNGLYCISTGGNFGNQTLWTTDHATTGFTANKNTSGAGTFSWIAIGS